MRVMTSILATSAILTFSLAPALACEWEKSASTKLPQSTADATDASEALADVSIATNDLTDETVKELEQLPVPSDKPAN